MARAGRRPGPTETPGAILTAARTLFAERGFRGTTIRAVADAAAVNPALVHHYFGTKNDLYIAALEFPVNPLEMIMNILADGPQDQFPERLILAFVRLWRDPETGPRMQAVLRGAVGSEDGAAHLRTVIQNVLPRAAAALGVPEIRVALAMSHLVGLMLGATVIQVGVLAEADEYQIVDLVTPAITRYLAP